MSLSNSGDTGEPHIFGKRLLANVTLFAMLGLGFMYQQTIGVAELEGSQDIQQGAYDHEVEAETPEAAKEPDPKSEIIKAINESCASLNEEDVSRLANIIQTESKKYNYDWKLILAIIKTESQCDMRARSHKGARGLMQVLPSTAEWLSPKMGLEYAGMDTLYDPEYNIKLGTRYLYMLHQKFGNMDKAIVAYNRGPYGLTRYLRQGRKFPPEYLIRVMGYYKELKDGVNEYAG
jgi:soluble lytic murein transglycosylase-like protein